VLVEKDEFPLPAYRHLPGQNERPSDGVLESIASQVSALPTACSEVNYSVWVYSVRLINEHYFWEAHEVLEAIWNCATPNSRERSLVQCLIQLSNARLKVTLGQPRAAKRLKQLSSDCFERAYGSLTEPIMGISHNELAAAITLCDSENTIPKLTVVEILGG